jgi:hypothetical protein
MTGDGVRMFGYNNGAERVYTLTSLELYSPKLASTRSLRVRVQHRQYCADCPTIPR